MAFSYDLARRSQHLRGYRKLVKPENLQYDFHTIQSRQANKKTRHLSVWQAENSPFQLGSRLKYQILYVIHLQVIHRFIRCK